MKSNFFAKIFVPKERKFFDFFEENTKNNCRIVEGLWQLVHEPDEAKRLEIKNRMHDLEHANDQITHKVLSELGRSFITPFDREDIHSLVSKLDDVTDFIYVAGKSILLYKIDATKDTTILAMTEVIKQAAEELNNAIIGLRDLKGLDKIEKAIVRINDIENHADDLLYSGIEHLFATEKDPIEIMKKRETYYLFESITDKCEDVCDVIEDILIKHA